MQRALEHHYLALEHHEDNYRQLGKQRTEGIETPDPPSLSNCQCLGGPPLTALCGWEVWEDRWSQSRRLLFRVSSWLQGQIRVRDKMSQVITLTFSDIQSNSTWNPELILFIWN